MPLMSSTARQCSGMCATTGPPDAEMVYSKEGVTQGDPMAMFLYALGILPIINQLKHHQLDVESLNRVVEQL
eukprot:4551543-Ditylum_brightwellii.AAC.2